MNTHTQAVADRPIRSVSRFLVHAVAALVLVVVAVPVRAHDGSMPQSFADLVEKLAPSVVDIHTITGQGERNGGQGPFQGDVPPKDQPFSEWFKNFQDRFIPNDPDSRPTHALGSGFIIDGDGHVVTNHHVIANAGKIKVRLHDGTVFDATVKGSDEKTDVAVLKIEPGDSELQAVEFGDSDTVRVGDWVLAIGNPFNLSGTVTAGIVSARGRDIHQGSYDDFIQTDASINTGNSGGPLFNLDGKVVGINTAIFTRSGGSVGIGFAVPSRLAMTVIDDLREDGVVKRGWLGVHIQTVTPIIAESVGLKEATGALVANVRGDSPAEGGGLKVGDVILEFGGKPVETMRSFPLMVARTPAGTVVDVVVWRDGGEQTLQVRIGELTDVAQTAQTDDGPVTVRLDEIGLTVVDLDSRMQRKWQIDADASGVLVLEVHPDGPAAEQGIRPGDVIELAGGEKVTGARQLEGVVADAVGASDKSAVLLAIRRNDNLIFIAIGLKRE